MPSQAVNTRIAAQYGKLPLSFEPNRGQTDKSVQFLSHGQGYTLFLRDGEAVLSLNGGATRASKTKLPRNAGSALEQPPTQAPSIARMQLIGVKGHPAAIGMAKQITQTNYFTGNDPAKWRTEIPNYGQVKYAGIYSGIDLVYYGNQRRLEHDFVVAPGADPGRIAFRLSGNARLDDATGDLVTRTAAGEVRLKKPVTYQQIDGARREVTSSYKVSAESGNGLEAGFHLGAYDRSAPLVIDPVLVYSTYLGGSGSDSATAIAVDSAGNAYVTGNSSSSDFPLSHGLQSTAAEFFVSEIKADGSALVYSTYLGSDLAFSAYCSANAIAVDAAGDAYIAGEVFDYTFPIKNAYQPKATGSDAFLTEIKAGGSSLVYSTYLGGAAPNAANAIAVDSRGDAYIAGYTYSTDFPTYKAFQPNLNGDEINAFVTEFKPGGQSLVYSTYLGGTFEDFAYGIAVDAAGDAFVTGSTSSFDFPTKNPYQLATGAYASAFVTEFKAGGQSLVYSTFLGGSYQDEAAGIAVDAAGDAFIAGTAASYDFPTVNAYQSALAAPFEGGSNAFVAEFKAGGQSLVYSTYLGGTNTDVGAGVGLDAAGNAYVTGYTYDIDFPLANPLQSQNAGSPQGEGINAFVSEFAPGGKSLVYSTYLGGTGNGAFNGDQATAIAVDKTGNAYVTGSTFSGDFPTVNALQPMNNAYPNGTNGFIAKIGVDTNLRTAAPTFVPTGGTYDRGQLVYLADATPGAQIFYTTTYGTAPTTASTLYTGPFTVSGAGTIAAVATASDHTQSAIGRTYYQFRVDQPTFSGMAGTYNQTEAVTLADSSPGAAIHYTVDGSTPTAGSTLYTAPIQVTSTETITAVGTLTGFQSSTVNQRTYSPPTAAPIVSPATATYYSAQTVSISDGTPGARIYYTTAYGATPTTASTLYTAPFTVNASETVAAIAVAPGFSTSVTGSTYIGLRATEPAFDHAGITYTGPITLTISEATPGATLYYTNNGTVPNASATKYTGPINITSSERIEAVAILNGYQPSSVMNAYFTIH